MTSPLIVYRAQSRPAAKQDPRDPMASALRTYRRGINSELCSTRCVCGALVVPIAAGMAGYAVQQTRPDSGSGANLGAFKGRVIGLGPLTEITMPIVKTPVSFCFKYDFEFAAQNRSSGNELWLTGTVRF
jgi:hypothetical protein